MIPLRRQLIVDEHETLPYPEGTACADVLEAGERGGSFASRVFLGLGLGGLYTLFQNENLLRPLPRHPQLLARPRLAAPAQRRRHPRRRHPGVPRRRLHHRHPRRRHHARRQRLLVARAHAGHRLLRLAPYHPALPRHRPHRADEPVRPLEDLRPAHGCRRRGRRRPHHPPPHPPHHRRRPHPGPAQHPREPRRLGQLHHHAVISTAQRGGETRPVAPTAHDLPPAVVFGGSLLLVVLLWIFLEFHPVPARRSAPSPTSPPPCSSSSSASSSSPSPPASSASSAAPPRPSPA